MKTITKHFLTLTISILTATTSVNVFAWDLEKDDDGIQVFTDKIEGSDFKAFRGTMIVNVNLEEALAVIGDSESMDEWVHECTTSQIMEGSTEDEKIIYQESNAPWPVTDRNFVLRSKTMRAEDGQSARVEFSAMVEPEVPNDDCVRVTELTGSWQLTVLEDGQLEIIYETKADPAGDIPAWLANAFVVDQPFYTLSNLRERMVSRD